MKRGGVQAARAAALTLVAVAGLVAGLPACRPAADALVIVHVTSTGADINDIQRLLVRVDEEAGDGAVRSDTLTFEPEAGKTWSISAANEKTLGLTLAASTGAIHVTVTAFGAPGELGRGTSAQSVRPQGGAEVSLSVELTPGIVPPPDGGAPDVPDSGRDAPRDQVASSGTGGAGAGGAGGAGTGGSGTGGSGGAGTGTGGMGAGGRPGSGGTGVGGGGGTGIGTGGRIGTGGTPGTGGTGTGGAGGASIGSVLDGLTWVVPCGSGASTTRTCSDLPAAGTCTTSTDPILKGNISVNKSVTFNGGAAGATYLVQIRIRGLAQLRTYSPAGAAGSMGWQAGGTPSVPYSSSIIYMLRVSAPAKDYFLNAIATPIDATSDNSAYMLDYTATLSITTGATVQLVAADPGCSIAKNCTPPTTSAGCSTQTFTGLTVPGVTQPFNGQFLMMNVVSVTGGGG